MKHGAWRFWPRRFRHPSRIAERSGGYNLVVLAVAVTVLNVVAAKALPSWTHIIQRAKEEELIFRGMQYAEALRIYQMRNGALPTKLEQLVEVEPRSIRKLWENPMADDGSWILVPAAQGRELQGGNDPDQRGPGRDDRGRGRQNRQGRELLWVPGGEQQIGSVPISGVKSSVGGDAIKVFAPLGAGGGDDYSQWRFTIDLVQGLGSRSVGAPDGTVQVPTLNAADIGKPWPPGISLPRFQGGRSPGRDRNPGNGEGSGGGGGGQGNDGVRGQQEEQGNR